MKITHSSEIYELLEEKYQIYQNTSFIENDPISIPHLFNIKEDIEIAGFLIAIISWGQRKSIIKNGKRIIEIMDFEPHNFILHHEKSDLKKAESFIHRTFNSLDLCYFFTALQYIYKKLGGLEAVFSQGIDKSMKENISNFKRIFFNLNHLKRSEKHLADPNKGSAAKRINMFLRWMVRDSKAGVDFGIWHRLKTNQLMLPLDIHTASTSRLLGLLQRKQNDWKAVEEVTSALREFDPVDPIKYDFALFGMGENGDLNL